MILLPDITDDFDDASLAQKLETETAKAIDMDENPVLNGNLLAVIFQHGIEAIPDDFNFRLEFVKQYVQIVDAEVRESLASKVKETIKKDFCGDVKAQCELIAFNLHGLELGSIEYLQAVKKALEEYEEFLNSVLLILLTYLESNRKQNLRIPMPFFAKANSNYF